MSFRQSVVLASQQTRLFYVGFKVAEAWTADPTDYWTITLWLRRAGEAIGRVLGTPLDLSEKSVAARHADGTDVEIALWTPGGGARGLLLETGDEVYAVTQRVNSPVDLVNPRLVRDMLVVTK